MTTMKRSSKRISRQDAKNAKEIQQAAPVAFLRGLGALGKNHLLRSQDE
jgi:hypothetical protein